MLRDQKYQKEIKQTFFHSFILLRSIEEENKFEFMKMKFTLFLTVFFFAHIAGSKQKYWNENENKIVQMSLKSFSKIA